MLNGGQEHTRRRDGTLSTTFKMGFWMLMPWDCMSPPPQGTGSQPDRAALLGREEPGVVTPMNSVLLQINVSPPPQLQAESRFLATPEK